MSNNNKLELKVYEPLKMEDQKAIILKKNLPKPPFRMVIVGSTGSGKSNLIKNFIYNFYKEYFDEIYIFCGSADDIEEYERLGDKTKYRLFNYKKNKLYKSKTEYMTEKLIITQKTTAEEIEELLEQIEEDEEKPRVLLIFDDMITTEIFKRSSNMNVIDTIMIRGRHIGRGLSVIFSTQKATALNRNIRNTNNSHIILFSNLGKLELKTIAEENAGNLDEKDFMKLYYDLTKNKYSFMIINKLAPPEKRFQNQNFEYIK